MGIRLDNMTSPCVMCFQKGIVYDDKSEHCKKCEYNLTVQLLKKIIKSTDSCALCKNRENLGGGYWDCKLGGISNGCCDVNNDFVIDWEETLKEYNVEAEGK